MASTPTNRTVNIYINQASAERSLQNLTKTADKMTAAIEKGEKAGKDMTAEIVKLGETKAKIQTLTDQVDGKLAPSFTQVRARVSELRKELENMSTSAPGYAAKFEDFKKVNARFQELQGEIRGVGRVMEEQKPKASSFLGSLSDIKKTIGAVALGTLTGNAIQAGSSAILGFFTNTISGNAKLSDSLAAVQQTTQLTDSEIQNLQKDLKGFDTRTARAELLKIAEIGGQFNVPKEQLAAFVQQVDKLNVVLGSEFSGGAEEITTEMSLLRNVFLDIKSDNVADDLSHISNAMVVLAQEGAATAPGVTDFAKRLSPLEATAKLTTGQILGLSASLQELAINPERGGTAVVRLFGKMAENAEAFAKVAGIGANEFKKLLNQDAFGAFQKVLEGFKNGGSNLSQLSAIVKELEVNGVGAQEVLVKLSENTKLLSERSDLATESLKKTDAITEQFNVKNNNLAAVLEKIGKKLATVFASPAITDGLKGLVMKFADLLELLPKMFEWFKDNALAFKLWGAALLVNSGLLPRFITYIGTLITGVKGLSIAQIANTIATNADIIATTSLSIIKALLTGNIVKLRQEWALLTTVIGRNPLGLLLVAAGAVAIAVNTWSTKTIELTEAEKEHLDVTRQLTQTAGAQLGQLDLLKRKTRDLTLSLEDRTKAAKQLQDLYPDIFANLSTEQILAGKIADAYDRAAKSIIAKAKAQVFEQRLQDAAGKREEQLDLVKSGLNRGQELRTSPNGSIDIQGLSEDFLGAIPGKVLKAAFAFNKLNDSVNDYTDKIIEAQKANETLGKTETAATGGGLAYGDPVADKAAKKAADKLEKQQKKEAKQLEKGLDDMRKYVAEQATYAQKLQDDLYGQDIQESKDFFNKQRQAAKEAYADGTEDLYTYQQGMKAIDQAEATDRAAIQERFADLVKAAAKGLEDSKTEALEKGVQDRKDLDENEAQSFMRQLRQRIRNTQNGSLSNLQAQRDLLKAQYDAEIANAKKTGADVKAINENYIVDDERLKREAQVRQIREVLQYAEAVSSVLKSLSSYADQKANEELDEYRFVNDQKKASLQKRLDSGLISEASYNRALENLAKDQKKKEDQLKHQKFIRDKALALVTGAIAGAQAIISAYAQGGPYLAAVVGAGVGIELGIIAASKEPKYSRGKRPTGNGGVPDGPSHAGGGIALVNSSTGQRVGEMEGNEAILSKNTYRNNRGIVDALLDSSMYGGGKSISANLYSRPPQINYAAAQENLRYANGGIARGGGSGDYGQTMKRLADILEAGISADVSWNEIDKKNQQMARLKKAASYQAV